MEDQPPGMDMRDWVDGVMTPFEAASVIETERLHLRAMRADDLEALFAIFSDPVVMAAFDSQPFDHEQMERWLNRNLRHQQQFGCGLFSVIDKASGLLIGNCGLEMGEIAGRWEAELGYDFRRDHWGRGFATEAAAAVRDHAFEVLGLPRLVSLIRQGNQRSRRVSQKLGMRHARDLELGGVAYWLYQIDSPLA